MAYGSPNGTTWVPATVVAPSGVVWVVWMENPIPASEARRSGLVDHQAAGREIARHLCVDLVEGPPDQLLDQRVAIRASLEFLPRDRRPDGGHDGENEDRPRRALGREPHLPSLPRGGHLLPLPVGGEPEREPVPRVGILSRRGVRPGKRGPRREGRQEHGAAETSREPLPHDAGTIPGNRSALIPRTGGTNRRSRR